MELRLNSPSGGNPAVYHWPLITAVSVLSAVDCECAAVLHFTRVRKSCGLNVVV